MGLRGKFLKLYRCIEDFLLYVEDVIFVRYVEEFLSYVEDVISVIYNVII